MKNHMAKTDILKTVLITGGAGFIGFHLSKRLLDRGYTVVGYDNLNEYYDVGLKHSRLDILRSYEKYTFIKGDLADADAVNGLFSKYRPSIAVNLGAQAGVRFSIENPGIYIQSNIVGFFNILEACRNYPVEHLIYASSSSVYGSNKKAPFEESDFVDHPVSLYAATKKSNELMAYAYSCLYGIPATGLRFFTVYGPFGRPDMMYFSFTDRYFADEPVRIFNNGDFKNDLYRDFTYIDDAIEGIERLLHIPPGGDVPHKVFNIGNSSPQKLTAFVETLERCLSVALGRDVIFKKVFEPIKPGDVPVTFASTDLLEKATGFKPATPMEEGLRRFTDWYVGYYKVK